MFVSHAKANVTNCRMFIAKTKPVCFQYVANDGAICTFRTNKDAPNYRLIKINLESPEQEKWEVLVPQHANDVLDWATAACKDKLVLCYLHDVKVNTKLIYTLLYAIQ